MSKRQRVASPELVVVDTSSAVYELSAPDSPVSKPTGPQCSQHSEFCFFCAYAEQDHSTNVGDVDLRGTLVTLVRALETDNKEIHLIVQALYGRYNESIRTHVPGQPSWSQESIHRHLLYSTEFASLFHHNVTQMFHSLLYKLNESMLDGDGNIVDDCRKSFIETTASFLKWQGARPQKIAKK